ncbi:hypothetical protein ELI13_21335 [Rhizobium ruizarguesonis]|uniref:Uncharacterized protein n=1 Tax=Rhizobium ruizarguesonis TaxID=2081791 RepID=A0ABY1XEZ1_9HYPH|nr:hypothetical protein [Rhizobium leguminosarum bv. viciae]NKQ71600.1 hypothetical protein [Rhizobium ruizarguesonis]NKQ78519.1 hypothetical protein [Rhizobium ruizarguesonis]NKQ89338.1 hypothetical protein [Rhizobium ruizarguesonis]TAU28822.1 hypothetical protein ELI48_23130 [Rhizobium ruizarguesonis]
MRWFSCGGFGPRFVFSADGFLKKEVANSVSFSILPLHSPARAAQEDRCNSYLTVTTTFSFDSGHIQKTAATRSRNS